MLDKISNRPHSIYNACISRYKMFTCRQSLYCNTTKYFIVVLFKINIKHENRKCVLTDVHTIYILFFFVYKEINVFVLLLIISV